MQRSRQRRALVALALLAAVSAATARVVAVHSDQMAAAALVPGRGAFAGAVSRGPVAFKGELLVWASGGFSTDEVKRVRDSPQVAAIVAVRAGQLAVESRKAGYPVVPVEAMAVNREAYADALGRPAGQLAGMLRKGAVLSATGARLRALRTGGRLRLAGGRTVPVTGVVADWVIGGYEVALDRDLGRQLRLERATSLLLRPRGSRPAFEAAIRRLLPGRALRFRAPGERPLLRAGDGALPFGQVKLRFGEFAVPSLARPRPDPRWVREHVTRAVVPVLGPVRCHKLIVPALTAAMAEVKRQRLQRLVSVPDFHRRGGCFAGSPVRGGGVETTRRQFGIALALNPQRPPVATDLRLVRVMTRNGFTWGGRWLRPDGGYFEWVGSGA